MASSRARRIAMATMLRFEMSIVQIVIARRAQHAEAISCRVAEIASLRSQ
jgi:hypothetical protein